jgi:hypothetical protein
MEALRVYAPSSSTGDAIACGKVLAPEAHSSAPEDVHGLSPWGSRAQSAYLCTTADAFRRGCAPEGRHILNRIFTERERSFHRRVAARGELNVSRLFASLLADGLKLEHVGWDWTRLQRKRYARNRDCLHQNEPCGALLRDRDVLAAAEIMDIGTRDVSGILFACDQPPRRDACASQGHRPAAADVGVPTLPFSLPRSPSPRAQPPPSPPPRLSPLTKPSVKQLTSSLFADGFAPVSRWPMIDLAALRVQARRAIERVSASLKAPHEAGTLLSLEDGGAPASLLPALRPLLEDAGLASVLRSYLGGPVRYDGAHALRVTNRVHPSRYLSANWHHDRCGRRIKLFIFLNDVDDATHPTLVGRGTHNLVYYTHAGQPSHRSAGGKDGMLLSRYTEEYVHSNFRVVPMLGRAGGGFLLDTNAIHKGEVNGSLVRETVTLEFHRHGKILHMQRKFLAGSGTAKNPCPSNKRNASEWPFGREGFNLYPQEARKTRASECHVY